MSLDDAQNLDDENYHAYMLQIRRADGTVVVSVTASLDFGRPWSLIPMRPDGKRHIADQGNVWVYTPDREIYRATKTARTSSVLISSTKEQLNRD